MRTELKQARLDASFTVSEIAEVADISVSFYYKIESGIRNPSISLAKKIADILGKKVDELFFNCNVDVMSKGVAATN